jgi:hypothetical protein
VIMRSASPCCWCSRGDLRAAGPGRWW